MENSAKVKVNFFRPITAHARSNMKLILTLALIWAVAVFGFQILLILVNKPVPEANYVRFQELWPAVVDGTLDTEQGTQDLAKVSLSVLGKNVALKEPHKEVLQLVVSKSIYQLLPEEQRQEFAKAPLDFLAENDMHGILGLSTDGFDKLLYDLLPTSLVPVQDGILTADILEKIPSVMQLYLIHNRSFLTDKSFIGFPFHYWYTAQFLLILFVVLCIFYAVSIDKLHKKHNIEE